MEVEERRAERSGASSTPSFERQMPDCMPSPLPPGTPAESQGSDSGCSCCQSDAEHKLTQRRSASQVKRSMLTDSPESSAAIPSKVMQERVKPSFWTIQSIHLRDFNPIQPGLH